MVAMKSSMQIVVSGERYYGKHYYASVDSSRVSWWHF